MDLNQEIKSIKNNLKAHSSISRAKSEKEYLKSPLDHYGVSMPRLRKIAKAWHKTHQDETLKNVFELSKELWQSNWHEDRTVSLLILELRSEELTHGHMHIFEEMAYQVTTWAHLDLLAVSLVGSILEKDRTGLLHLSVWAKSDNFWVRRAAILGQIKLFRQGKGNMSVFTNIVRPQLSEGPLWTKEEKFFIRKAIGWALRERSKADPESVKKFLDEYSDRMSGLTLREASKYLE